VKRVDLIRKLEKAGCELIRHGGNHDWYRNRKTGLAQPVPRHREVNEKLAVSILKTWAAGVIDYGVLLLQISGLDKRYVVQFKLPETITQHVIAATAVVEDGYLTFERVDGTIAALFAVEVVDSWSEER